MELVKPDGQAFNEHGVKVTMPYVVDFRATFLVEAVTERQARSAIERGVTVNMALTPYLLGMGSSAEAAPAEVLAEFVRRKK